MDAADILTIATQISGLDVGSFASSELGDIALAAERLRNSVEAFSAAVLAGLHERGPWADDGATSGAAWVAARTGGPLGELRRPQRAGLALRLLPAAAAACRSGRLSPDHQARLAGCAARHPARAARDEAVLVEQAERLAATSATPTATAGPSSSYPPADRRAGHASDPAAASATRGGGRAPDPMEDLAPLEGGTG